MQKFTLFGSLLFLCFSAGAQVSFDSLYVLSKIKAHMSQLKQELPVVNLLKEVAGKVEDRVDFSAPSFDFKRTEDRAYMKEKAKKVYVRSFADIRHSGCDVYIQNGTSKYPLSNLELHADASGKIVRDLPFQEIQQAMKLIEAGGLLSLQQVQSIYKNSGKSGQTAGYVCLLIDLPTSALIWQVRGVPNWQTRQQELMELDAKTGRMLRQEMKPISVTSSAAIK